jgi:alkylation response protein AidB-like acyl-CoA dehydrogenase
LLDLDRLGDAVPSQATDPRAVWSALGAAGIIARVVDPLVDKQDTAALGELLGWLDGRVAMGVTLSVCVQVATVVPLLRHLASPHGYAEEVLRGLETGRGVVALAVTDTGSGSSVATFETRIDTASATRLDGRKRWITNATTCTHALVLARRDDRRHFTSFSWVLVPVTETGVDRRPAETPLLPGSGWGDLEFDGVRLREDHLVGRPGRALADFAVHMTLERTASALWGRAYARRLLRRTKAILQARPSDGGTLWDNPSIRARYAACVVAWCTLDALCQGQPAGSHARSMMLKAHSGQTVTAIARECVSMAGAESFVDADLSTALGHAQIFDTAGGAAATMLAGVADHVDDLLGA